MLAECANREYKGGVCCTWLTGRCRSELRKRIYAGEMLRKEKEFTEFANCGSVRVLLSGDGLV